MPVLPYRKPEILNSCEEIGKIVKRECIDSVLVVTDKGIIANGLADKLTEVLKANDVKYSIYDETQPNPTVENVEKALEIYRKNKCNCLIAIGGGSSMDCAKAVGLKLHIPKKH